MMTPFMYKRFGTKCIFSHGINIIRLFGKSLFEYPRTLLDSGLNLRVGDLLGRLRHVGDF